MSFGYSIGDVVALSNLAVQIIQALDESRGATADYKSLAELLRSLTKSLHAVTAIFFHASPNSGYSPDPSLLNGIKHEFDCCKRLMDEFLRNSRKYTESLLNGKGARVKREWRKITWCMYKTEDVQKLQASLQGHIGAFQLYIFVINWQSNARIEQKLICASEANHRIEQKAVENTEISYRIELRIGEMFTLLKTLHDHLPKSVGYPWEGGCANDQKPIHFEDVLGRAVILPPMLCNTKETFHDVLKIMFKNLPGQKRITQKEYEVTDDTEGETIRDSDWEDKVLPGARITMAIVIKMAPSTSISQSRSHICSRCNNSNSGANPVKGSLKCRQCGLVFRTVDVEVERVIQSQIPRILELPEPPPLRNPELKVQGPSSPQVARRKVQEIREPGEEYAFRRIHYLREVLKLSPSPEVVKRNFPGETEFRKAVADGNLELVKALLSESADTNALVNSEMQDRHTGTTLQAAVEGRHLEVAELLLSYGADINADPAWYSGRTALQAAAQNGHLEAVEFLLSHGADINADPAEVDGRTALQEATQNGHLEAMEFLLSHGADINADPAWYSGRTALQAAAQNGHPEAMEFLLLHGADINAGPALYNGRTALQMAIEIGNAKAVELLTSHGAKIQEEDLRESEFGVVSAPARMATKGKEPVITQPPTLSVTPIPTLTPKAPPPKGGESGGETGRAD